MNKWRVYQCRWFHLGAWCGYWNVESPDGWTIGRHKTFAQAIDHADQRARTGRYAVSVKVFAEAADR